MKRHAYFMPPRVYRETYDQGWKGHKTLVLGASLPCSLKDCPMKEACMRNSRDFDKACFWYRQFPDRDDLCLSNSNFIEVDSFIEGNPAHYFADFTKFMIGKLDEIPLEIRAPFWNHVAFYNYDQNIHFTLNDNDSADHAHDTEENYQGFLQVLDELQPEVIYVWFEEVKNILVRRHIEGLQEIEQLNVNGITVYRFIYQIQPTPKPQMVVEQFCNTFSGSMESKDHPESYLLHALYRARYYHQTLPYTPLHITDEMVDFACPYAWDESLYRFLIQSLQKQLGLDMACDFIQKKWVDPNNFYIASNFFCGVPHHIPLDGFSPSELSFFSLADNQVISERESGCLDCCFVYLDENTEKRVLSSLLDHHFGNHLHKAETFFSGIFLSVDDVPFYEVPILKTHQIRSIHLLQGTHRAKNTLVYIEFAGHSPVENIELYRGLTKIAKSSYAKLIQRESGKRLLPRELTTENKIIDLSPLDVLCKLQWIQLIDDKNHYSILTEHPIIIPGKKRVADILLPAKCECTTSPQIKGLIYTYLMYKLSWSQQQLINFFPDIPKASTIRDQKRRALECFKACGICKIDGKPATKFCGELIDEYISILQKEQGAK